MRDVREKAEQDVSVDPGVARTRATGGVPDHTAVDQHSTTGTTPTHTFVGRIAGSDPGYVGETGAEARAAAERARAHRGPRPGSPAGRSRGRIGRMIGEIFLAGSDEEAVAHLDQGPFVDGVAEAVSVGELTSLEFDALQSVLTGASFRDVLESGEGGLIDVSTGTGPWVSRVRPRLTGALADLDGSRVGEVARRWAERDEVESIPVDTLVAVLTPLTELARTAGERDQRLYLWNSL